MVEAFLVLLACQLCGEAIVRGFYLPLPGPVVGMALLFVLLLWKGDNQNDLPSGRMEGLGKVSDGLLQNLSLLFVPAAVGIIQHFGLIREYGLSILLSLVVSTILTLAVTAIVFERLARSRYTDPDTDGGDNA